VGFEVYVQCVGETEKTGISRTAVCALFPIVAEESQGDYWRVRYDDKNACHIGVIAVPSDEKMLKSIVVERPCGEPKLWDALISVMKMGSVVMFWPGGPPIVCDGAAAPSLPQEMTNVMGAAKPVNSAEDILRLLRET
jgi:hypothetical protein